MDNQGKGQFRKGVLVGSLAAIACVVVIGLVGLLGVSYLRTRMNTNSGSSSQSQNADGDTDNDNAKSSGSVSDNIDQILSKIKTIENYIDKYYLYDSDTDDMIEGIYKGLVDSLDEPYTEYLTAEEYASSMSDYSGNYYGIGVEVSQDKDTGVITVVRVFKESPAREAGIEAGDILYKVEGEEVTGEDLDGVVAKVKGESGTFVSIEVYRESTDSYIELDVERREVTQDVVEYEMLDGNIGYVALSTFHEQSKDQLKAALEDLKSQGMEGLILDLRNNSGGLLTSMQDIADIFLPANKLVLSVESKSGVSTEYKTSDNDSFDLPVVVLTNGYTASASEALLGALQDHGVVECVVGTNTFGKGIVQTYFPLTDGSALKLTNYEYFTPDGRAIHGEGIAPDVEVELDDSDEDNQLTAAVTEMKDLLGR